MVHEGIPNVPEVERAELESVLRSKILLRSPSVLRIAEYIARIYLEGDSKDIKEYNIAVDALGKPVDFDPKTDSIVRVEVHRLRKKIDQFYRTEGVGRPLRLVIDPGKYIPRFESAPQPLAEPCAAIPPVGEIMPPILEPPTPRRSWGHGWVAGILLVFTLALAAWAAMRVRTAPVPDPVFLIAGGPEAMVAGADTGIVISGDRWFHGGTALYPAPSFPLAPGVTQTGQRSGNFEYDIPLASVPWELRLYFGPRADSETAPTNIGRGFDVFANGVPILNSHDPDLGWVSPSRSIIRVFRDIRPGPDHQLHLSFRSGRMPAYISAISLSPGEAGHLLPIRLISKAAPWTDTQGRAWSPDSEYVTGGKLKLRPKFDSDGLDHNLLVGERYGEFAYHIPVSKGTFGLKLYFGESWFGPGLRGGGGIGSRRFDVYAERHPLLQDFDIFRSVGHKPLIKEFHGLIPNADGYISLSFLPRVNYAAINALELTEESGFKF